MNEVSLEKIVSLVVREVVKELTKNGFKITSKDSVTGIINSEMNDISGLRTKVERIDMSSYKTPVLTENHINRLHELTGEIIVPQGTVLTPKAKEAIRNKKIVVNFE